MKTKLFTLFSLLALLLVSTAILADGRPTGIRIGSVRNISAVGVEIDITVPGTDDYYPNGDWQGNTSVWLGNTLQSWASFYVPPYTYFGTSYGGTTRYRSAWQYASDNYNVPLPWAIDWGDGSHDATTVLFGPPGGPFVGTFKHTYPPAGSPASYTITAGDAVCCSTSPTVTTGTAISGSVRYVWGLTGYGLTYFGTFYSGSYGSTSQTYRQPVILALTANGTVTTSTAIPALNIYGLLAMAFVLVGAGLLLYRKPQQA